MRGGPACVHDCAFLILLCSCSHSSAPLIALSSVLPLCPSHVRVGHSSTTTEVSLFCHHGQPPCCASCSNSCNWTSRGCTRSPVLCASCCRYQGGCTRHVVQQRRGAPSSGATEETPRSPSDQPTDPLGDAPPPTRRPVVIDLARPEIDLTQAEHRLGSAPTPGALLSRATTAAAPTPELVSAFTTFMVQWLAQQQAATSQHPHRAPTTGLQPAYNQPTTDPQRGGVFGAPGPQYAPASHLSSYPPPPGGAHVPPPFDAARSASVSSQPAHSGVTVSNNNHTHSPVTVYIDRDRGSTPERQRTATASAARRPLTTSLRDGFLGAWRGIIGGADLVTTRCVLRCSA